MTRALPRILTINGGSSTIKFALFEAGDPVQRILAGAIEGIGQKGATCRVRSNELGKAFVETVSVSDYPSAIALLMEWIERNPVCSNAAAIGHRIVHGGPRYCEPVVITPDVLAELRRLTVFDPEHLPEEILLVEACRARFGEVPQVACFDTEFHHDLPRVARILPIPRRYEIVGIRRYGFHGLSYAFLMEELARIGDPAATNGRVILVHLGSGASLAAVLNGKSIDTSMSFTPTSGLPMSTRSGDLDPGLSEYLARTEGMSPRQFSHMTTTLSGLLGISETSSDMRELLHREPLDVRAAEAVALFCYQAKKWIGAFAAALGGVDTLVFAGGIAENSSLVRERICTGLEFLGIELADERNGANGDVISAAGGHVTVRVIRTDEEIMVAKSVVRLLAIGPCGDGRP